MERNDVIVKGSYKHTGLLDDLKFTDINEKSFDGFKILEELKNNNPQKPYYFYIDEVGIVEQLNPNNYYFKKGD